MHILLHDEVKLNGYERKKERRNKRAGKGIAFQ